MLHFKASLFILLLLTPTYLVCEPLKIVATTGMIGDTAQQIGGELVQVETLMGEGVDPHLYKPAPGDIRKLLTADLVLYNGLHLEGKMGETLEKIGKNRAVVAVAEAIPQDRLHNTSTFGGTFDPHVWFDPQLWAFVAQRISVALKETLPANQQQIDQNTRMYMEKLSEIDRISEIEVNKIPASQRLLITAHDAFGYFGARYKIEVRGIQGISTDSEASLRDIENLVQEIVSRRVAAVFVESSVSHKTVESLIEGARAKGHIVKLGGELYSDALGASGTEAGTYLGMFRHNVMTITSALGAK